MNSVSPQSVSDYSVTLGKENVVSPTPALFTLTSKSPSLILAKMDFFKIFPEEELRCPRSKQILNSYDPTLWR